MSLNDPVSDFLTRIRNAQQAEKKWVDIPSSNLIIRISHVLKEEAFIRYFILVKDDKQGILRLFLKYDDNSFPVIHHISRVSKPGRRIYASSTKLPRVLNGMGVSILTTSKGVISSKKARDLKVGGEVLCQVW